MTAALTTRPVQTREQRLRDDPTLRVSADMVRVWAEESGVCVRPLLRRVTDRENGSTVVVPIPCGSTRESVCTSCARRARALRMQQCAEGWHRSDEPETDPAVDDVDQGDPEDEVGGGPAPDAGEDDDERRSRSTRRRDDAPDLPRVPRSARTVGRTWVGNDGRTYRPSMFVTLTLPSYGRITPGTGTPVDPDSYDYARAAADAVHLPRLLSRWVQNLRRCAGYTVQYFAAVEPQRRLAPHVHLALRGAIPRATLTAVTKATYAQVWWPPTGTVVYDDTDDVGLPVWTGERYVDPVTGTTLRSWDAALDDLDRVLDADPGRRASHVTRFGPQSDVQGIIAPSADADRAIRYLTKYLTKTLADTYTPARDEAENDDGDDAGSDPDRGTGARARRAARVAAHERHIDRLQEEVRWVPCSPECANWLRHGIEPKNPGPGLVPGQCPKRAHDRENLGYGGRRVQVSRAWSGKTLTVHKADRAAVVRAALDAAGIEAPARDRLAADTLAGDGLPRFVWDDVAKTEADYAGAILASIRERQRWREQYEQARKKLESDACDGTDPPGPGCGQSFGKSPTRAVPAA